MTTLVDEDQARNHVGLLLAAKRAGYADRTEGRVLALPHCWGKS